MASKSFTGSRHRVGNFPPPVSAGGVDLVSFHFQKLLLPLRLLFLRLFVRASSRAT